MSRYFVDLYGHLFHIKTGVMGSSKERGSMFLLFTGCSLLIGQCIEPGYKLVTSVLEGVGWYQVCVSFLSRMKG